MRTRGPRAIVATLFALAGCTSTPADPSRLRITAASVPDLVNQIWDRAWRNPWDAPAIIEWVGPAENDWSSDDDSAAMTSLPVRWHLSEPWRSTPMPGGGELHELMVRYEEVGMVWSAEEPLARLLTARGIPHSFPTSQGVYLIVPRLFAGFASDVLNDYCNYDGSTRFRFFGNWIIEGNRRIAPDSPVTFTGGKGLWILRDTNTERAVAAGVRTTFAEKTTVQPPPGGWARGHVYRVSAAFESTPVDANELVAFLRRWLTIPLAQGATFLPIEHYQGNPIGARCTLVAPDHLPLNDERESEGPQLWWRPRRRVDLHDHAVALAVVGPADPAPVIELRSGVHVIDPARVVMWRTEDGSRWDVRLPDPEPHLTPGSRIFVQYLVVLGPDRETLLSEITAFPVEHGRHTRNDVDDWLAGTELKADAESRRWFATTVGSVHSPNSKRGGD